jgi:hypothetical protein
LILSLSIDTSGDKQQNKYEYLLVDIKGKKSNVALVQLNRPKALNALCDGLMTEVRIIIYLLIYFNVLHSVSFGFGISR